MYYLVTIKNTGDSREYNKAFIYFRNSYHCVEYFKDNGHAHLLIKTTQYLYVFDFIKRFRCYLHFRQVRNREEDINRVKKYIKSHLVKYKGGDIKMDIGKIKVWVKRKKEEKKVVLTIQMPKWYDLSRNRAVITWSEEEFKQFLKYLVQETGITKIRVKKAKGKNNMKVVKGFDKAIR